MGLDVGLWGWLGGYGAGCGVMGLVGGLWGWLETWLWGYKAVYRAGCGVVGLVGGLEIRGYGFESPIDGGGGPRN